MHFSFGIVAGLAVLYFVAAKVGLLLAAVSPSATPVWPPTGIAFAMCLVLGARVWPAIFAAAFLANITTAGSVVTSLGIAAGNTLEALVGAYLVGRLANGPAVFDRARDIFAFVGLAALASTTVSATIGLTTLALGGYVQWAEPRVRLADLVAGRCHRQSHLRAPHRALGEEPVPSVDS